MGSTPCVRGGGARDPSRQGRRLWRSSPRRSPALRSAAPPRSCRVGRRGARSCCPPPGPRPRAGPEPASRPRTCEERRPSSAADRSPGRGS
ncbi:MAG: hypothetical protein F9K43_29560 [Bauldia sp.]|nr:MAG: hypothetical protein F9K43_29560 [Bauldia sp.]